MLDYRKTAAGQGPRVSTVKNQKRFLRAILLKTLSAAQIWRLSPTDMHRPCGRKPVWVFVLSRKEGE